MMISNSLMNKLKKRKRKVKIAKRTHLKVRTKKKRKQNKNKNKNKNKKTSPVRNPLSNRKQSRKNFNFYEIYYSSVIHQLFINYSSIIQ
jgi:hypothetical protein